MEKDEGLVLLSVYPTLFTTVRKCIRDKVLKKLHDRSRRGRFPGLFPARSANAIEKAGEVAVGHGLFRFEVKGVL